MSNYEKSLDRHIKIMNRSFTESQRLEDEYTADFKKIFEKSVEHVERLVKMRALAMGLSEEE